MQWLVIAVAVLVGLAVLVLIIGWLRPKTHVASHSALLPAPPARVWSEIADVDRSPEWVPGITRVERLRDSEGRPSYRESFGGFQAVTVVTVLEPPRRMVKEILPGGPFHGSWTWELVPEGDGTRLTITERGTVENPFFRGMMLFQDPTKSARQYAGALARRLAGR